LQTRFIETISKQFLIHFLGLKNRYPAA